MKDLTELETRVLKALTESSEGNGHDFGLIIKGRTWRDAGLSNARMLGALVASIKAKGYIADLVEMHPEDGGNPRVHSQFVLSQEYIDTLK